MSGCLRQNIDDFAVTEVLGFDLDGLGEHDFLWLEKKGANTAWVSRQLAAYAGIPPRDVGYAGMKDRHAVTRQWFSVRRPGGSPADWACLDVEGVRVLEVSRNTRKLRRGAHKGNRFCIIVRDLERLVEGAGNELIEARVSQLRQHGVPNYFGEQRFGHRARNLDLAQSLFAGKRLKREKRSIALSAARSWIFNHLLQFRVEDDTWSCLRPGDIAVLDGSGSFFLAERIDDPLRERSRRLDLHPSGPLWGASDKAARLNGDNIQFEREMADRFPDFARGLDEREMGDRFRDFARGLERHSKLSRRALRLAVRDLSVSIDGDTLTLEFYLARGSFATAVLRELVDYG